MKYTRLLKNFLSRHVPKVIQNYLANNYWKNLDFDKKYDRDLNKIETIFSKIKNPNPIENCLEFGGSTGHNMHYLSKLYKINNIYNIDINKVVNDNKYQLSNYFPIYGSGDLLEVFEDNFFDLILVCSVFDHIVEEKIVISIIKKLIKKTKKKLVIVEPYIVNLTRNVSYLSRKDCDLIIEKDYKIFAKNSFLWDYKRILDEIKISYQIHDCPLHSSSLGPFYKIFEITK